jgi:hypothetical protein
VRRIGEQSLTGVTRRLQALRRLAQHFVHLGHLVAFPIRLEPLLELASANGLEVAPKRRQSRAQTTAGGEDTLTGSMHRAAQPVRDRGHDDAAAPAEVLSKVLLCRLPPLEDEEGGAALKAVLDRALEREPDARFSTAMEMAQALEAAGVASTAEVASWVGGLASASLQARQGSLDALDRLAVVPPAGTLISPRRSRVPMVAGLVAAALVLASAPVFWPRQPVVQTVIAPPTVASRQSVRARR